jgi:hypothetical protein
MVVRVRKRVLFAGLNQLRTQIVPPSLALKTKLAWSILICIKKVNKFSEK